MLRSTLGKGGATLAVAARRVANSAASGARQMSSDGSDPIPAADPRKAGGKGATDRPYEMPRPKQDGPPEGGFGPIRSERTSANTSADAVSSWLIMGLTAGMMTYGFYGVYEGNRERRAFKQEKWFIRSTLMPLLQAEEDVAFLERQAKKRAEEARIMKDVPGWEVGKSVYHTKRWVLPPLNDMNYPGRWGPAE